MKLIKVHRSLLCCPLINYYSEYTVNLTYINDHYYLDLGLLTTLVLVIGTCFIIYMQLVETKVAKQTCASFTTYQQALQAFNMGNTGLDHNKNGIPCQSLL